MLFIVPAGIGAHKISFEHIKCALGINFLREEFAISTAKPAPRLKLIKNNWSRNRELGAMRTVLVEKTSADDSGNRSFQTPNT